MDLTLRNIYPTLNGFFENPIFLGDKMNTIDLVPPNLLGSARSLYELSRLPYHNWTHVLAVCCELDAFSNGSGIVIDLATALAAVGHDIICEARQGARNEERSAELFAKMLELHDIVNSETVTRVRELILLTDGHHELAPGDVMGAALIDADFAILGQPPEVYDWYRRAIREEWSNISDAKFSSGRQAFLSHVLERHDLYRTHFFNHRYQKQARENIGLELAGLKTGASP